ncbi:MAG: hypothetical protein JWR42_2776, partial [Marmoricola sp.]|nr:hypothetical protein [Marmoricola sp.]
MAEDRRKEPNLELPSLFGRKKKQKGAAPPDADSSAAPAPVSPAAPAADRDPDETVRTPS